MTEPHELFAALSDPTRLDVLTTLAGSGPATATEIAARMPVSRQAVSKHLSALDAAGLVHRESLGREVKYTFTPGPLELLARWAGNAGDQWDDRLERLKRSLD